MKSVGQIVKAVLFTVLYILIIILSGMWIWVADYFKMELLIYEYFEIISVSLILIFVAIFSIAVNRKLTLIPQRTSSWWYLVGAVCGALFVFFQAPLKWIFNWFAGTNYSVNYDLDGVPFLLTLSALASIILIPIAEELFFRDFLQRNLQKNVHPFLAIGTTALLFGAIHIPFENLFLYDTIELSFHHAYITSIGGIILGILYYKSKSVGPTIAMHAVWNLFALAL